MEGAWGENQLSACSKPSARRTGVRVDGVDLVDAVDRVELGSSAGTPGQGVSFPAAAGMMPAVSLSLVGVIVRREMSRNNRKVNR